VNTERLVKKLRRAAEVLEPFMRHHSVGALVWNGTAYVPSTETPYDIGAVVWRRTWTICTRNFKT